MEESISVKEMLDAVVNETMTTKTRETRRTMGLSLKAEDAALIHAVILAEIDTTDAFSYESVVMRAIHVYARMTPSERIEIESRPLRLIIER